MSCLFAFATELKYAHRVRAVVLFIFYAAGMQAQAVGNEAVNGATVRGTVRDTQGSAIAGVVIELQAKDASDSLHVHSDGRGRYSLAALHDGQYTLRAEMGGYNETIQASFFLAARERKKLDITLAPSPGSSASAEKSAPAHAPTFFDEPQFTVAGVTDATNLGGHGSDVVVRTREAMAKETVALASAGSAARVSSDVSDAAVEEKKLREEVEHASGNFEANHRLGVLLLDNGRAREAIPYLDHADAFDPTDFENAYDLARANADAGNDEDARADIKKLLARRDWAELHHLLGGIDEKLGNSFEAVKEYQRAAELDTREAYVFDWGSELLLHHAPEPAGEVFQRGNRLFPHSERMLIGLGAALFARGSSDQAVKLICAASDIDPGDSAPYMFLGRMLKAENAPSAGLVEKLHRFVRLQPQNAEANYYYAIGLWKLRKSPADTANLADIEVLLNRAIQINPALAAAHVQLGILRAEQKDYPKAISEYEQAIHSDAQLEEAHYRLSQLYRQTGEVDRATSELKIYDLMSKKSAEREERERHEIPQFVYTLRDQPRPQIH